MAVCNICNQRFPVRGLNRRLAIPEYRSVIGFWPWTAVQVCDGCAAGHDRDFRERLGLLAPDVLENDEPVVGEVCLACGATESDDPWREAAKWVDAAGRPTRRARFRLCSRHADRTYVDGLVVSSNLTDAARMAEVFDELPVAGGDLLARVEGWRPGGGQGPAGAKDFAAGRAPDTVLADAVTYWKASPEGLEAKAAWLGPVRKDYRMRYRLDLVRDYTDGRRETFIVVRTGPQEFATYRTAAVASKTEE